jgi:uncharacterized protein YceH (UPF0502 family)
MAVELWHPDWMTLSPHELRVLGALIEKEITTPETYPLSLNALQAACNQRSSRDPVLDLSEGEIRDALRSLEDLDLVTPVRDARVPKWEHRARTVLNLRRDETAALALLLLRGPQTPGEIRSRADRLFSFDDLASVTATLDRLASRPAPDNPDAPLTPETTGPLTMLLPRQPGARESRYTHLLGGPVDVASTPLQQPASGTSAPSPDLRAELAALQEKIQALELRIEHLESSISATQPDPADGAGVLSGR